MLKSNNIVIISFVFVLICVYFINKTMYLNEGYSNYTLENAGAYPELVDLPILDNFPHTGHKYASNDSSSGIWWYFPIFAVGSFEQITNNLRYRNNPDDGTCSRADMCGALYKQKKNKSNITLPLPEAEEGAGARVGYYRTTPNNLAFSIPTNENILY